MLWRTPVSSWRRHHGVRDVTVAAHGLTEDALHRIRSHLTEILPSLSPAYTRQMVDDAEKEAFREGEGERREEAHQQKQQQN
ncbi:hypothetical protein L1049_005088 [Liquidambar formosana]|uniref:Uncharacterized protein n=1 Tax=Liquidambar formosana TaxID=63359 RepID=A0AAP0WYX3_LIQFO